MTARSATIHPSSFVSPDAEIGAETQIWLNCQIRENVRIGAACILGKGVYVDANVTIGKNCKIQNNVSIFTGVTLEDGVFVGPHVCFTNDKIPRAVNADGSIKDASDWHVSPTLVKAGAALGANATIVCGVTIGEWAMIASGSVVTKDVAAHSLVMGNPAKHFAWICVCGHRVEIPVISGQCDCGRVLVKQAGIVRLAA